MRSESARQPFHLSRARSYGMMCSHIGDSGQKGTDVYWCEETGKWICADLDFPGQTVTCEEIALVRLHEDADPRKKSVNAPWPAISSAKQGCG